MMRAAFLALATPLVVALVPPVAAGAQGAAPDASRSATGPTASGVSNFVSVAVPASPAIAARQRTGPYAITMAPIAVASAAADDEGPSAAKKVFRAVIGVGVGAAVGGWLGYFGAQVANSDWKSITPTQKTELRQSYTVAGIGLGGVAGYFLRPKGRPASRLPQPINVPPRSGRLLLGVAELRRSIATNVLEAVELGRPEWVKEQREDEAKRGSQPSTLPVEALSLVVYVGDEKVGAVETLRDIAIPEVAELRFYDSRDARRRWGGEHKYGAIEVVPAPSTADFAQPAGVTTGTR